jgi:uncharacterized protein
VAGGAPVAVAAGQRVAEVRRTWAAGDDVVLDLDLATRVTPSDRRVDATRGCVVVERGPIVYAIESADLPDGQELEDIEVDEDVAPEPEARDDLAPGIVGLRMPARVRRGGNGSGAGQPVELHAIPYYAWGNRRVEAMRVWIPAGDGDAAEGDPAG